MTENVQIALIIVAALVVIVAIVVFVFRDKFQKGSIKVKQDGVQGGVETHTPTVSLQVIGVRPLFLKQTFKHIDHGFFSGQQHSLDLFVVKLENLPHQ